MRVVDITERLERGGRPRIIVSGVEIEVDNTAKTMLKVMSLLGDSIEDVRPQQVLQIYELIFDKKERSKIDKLGLSFPDFMELVNAAMGLVVGGEPGEAETRDTTS